MRDHFPSHLLHMAASMILILVPYVAKFSIYVGSMFWRETHWMDVSFGKDDSHLVCSTCSKGSMGDSMVTIAKHLVHYEVSHMIDWMPYDDDFQLITYEMVWASLFHNIGEIHGGLIFILPPEGNIVAARDQYMLCTYYEWREGQCRVGYYVYHV